MNGAESLRRAEQKGSDPLTKNKDGDAERNTLTEFNSNNTKLLNLEETKEMIAKLAYIQERLAEE